MWQALVMYIYESDFYEIGPTPNTTSELKVTAFKLSSTEYSGYFPLNTIRYFVHVIDDSLIWYGIIVIWSDSAVFVQSFGIDSLSFGVILLC